MAYDKVVDSAQLDADLTAVADAIRAKGGTDAQLAFPSGFVSAVQAIAAGGGDGIDVVMTSTITNAEELSAALTAGSGATQFAFAIKSYKNGAPIQNQICCGAYAGANAGAGVRYRDRKYVTMNGWNSQYDAAVTIGDIYTVWEISV